MPIQTVTFQNTEIPKLIFGTLTMSPLQRNMSVDKGAQIIAAALEKGLRWIDTAQLYGSHPQVKMALDISSVPRNEIIISTKSTAPSYELMKQAIHEAQIEMGIDYIDLFMMHAVRSLEDLDKRSGALEALLEAKLNGTIRQIGISTHSTQSAKVFAKDRRFDWYHLMFNKIGIGLTDGTLEEQEEVIKTIKERGAQFYAMKPLGGGYLAKDALESLQWIDRHTLVDAVALGMTSTEELDLNCAIFSGDSVDVSMVEKLQGIVKKLFVFKALCIGCKKCQETCEQKAIKVVEGKAVVDETKCIICGYCVPECPKFALRII